MQLSHSHSCLHTLDPQQPNAKHCVQAEDGTVEVQWALPWSTRLIDFGLSKRFAPDAVASLSAACTLAPHSVAWMAPETFTAARHTRASDVYSLGMVLWEVRRAKPCLRSCVKLSVRISHTVGPSWLLLLLAVCTATLMEHARVCTLMRKKCGFRRAHHRIACLQILTLSMPPTTHSAAYIASGAAFASGAATAHGPCDERLAELLDLEATGDVAALVRKMHGAPCPVLQPMVQLVRDMQQHDAGKRPSVAAVMDKLMTLERQCQGAPVQRIPSDSELTAAYWRESAIAGCSEQSSFDSFKTESDEGGARLNGMGADGDDSENECADWVRKIVRADSD